MLLTTTLTGILRETDGTPVIGRAVLINPVIRAVIAVSDGGLVLTAVSAATDDEGRLGIAAPDVPFVQGVALPVGEYDLVILGLDRKFGGRITITQDMVDAGTALLSQALELGPPAVVLSDLALLRAETIDARDGAIQAVDGAVQQALDGVDVIIADVAQDATRAETAADASALAAEALLADLAPFSAVPPAPAVINNYLRVNSAGDGFEYRTPSTAFSDMASADAVAARASLGLGTAAIRNLSVNANFDVSTDMVTTRGTIRDFVNAQTLLDTDWTDGALTTPAMISPAQLAQVGGGGWEYSPVVATTSGTAFDFTGIPDGVTEIEAIYRNIRFTATDHMLIQLGTSAGFQTTGYDSASGTGVRAFIKQTTGFALVVDGSTNRAYGKMTILNSGSGNWDETHNGSEMREGLGINGAGHVNITGAVDRLRLTRSGTATFNSGSFYIRWRK